MKLSNITRRHAVCLLGLMNFSAFGCIACSLTKSKGGQTILFYSFSKFLLRKSEKKTRTALNVQNLWQQKMITKHADKTQDHSCIVITSNYHRTIV